MNTFIKLLFVAILCSTSKATFSNCNDYVPGQLLVKFKQNLKTSNKAHLKKQMKAESIKTFPKLNVELWNLIAENEKTDIHSIIEQYKDHPEIEYIEPNYIYHLLDSKFESIKTSSYKDSSNSTNKRSLMTPNDPLFNDQWHLNNVGQRNTPANIDINALEAWNITSKSPSVKVAILDSGIDWKHEDLQKNIWQNLGEDADGDGSVLIFENGQWIFDPDDENGVDDDGNGYIDDFIGWDFLNDDNNPMDDLAHGTRVAGIIGAEGNNNIGVTGTSWDVKMAALKIFGTNGPAPTSRIIKALEYAVDEGFPISNNSWGGGEGSQALEEAIEYAQNNQHLFIASAGNSGSDNDQSIYYPASYDLDNIIVVAAIGFGGELFISSNYGFTRVDIAAPGEEIRTTTTINNYGDFFETSSAAPQVAAACALLKYLNPTYTVDQIKNTILSTATETQPLFGMVASNGMLNLNAALAATINSIPLCRNDDSLALIKIYENTKGEFWNNKWDLVNGSLSNWFGVQLDADGCVAALNLASNNLNGTIPQEIGDISNLTSLRLNNNQISGNIPKTINNLNELETLALQNNNLNGIVPVELYLINNLQDVNLSNNNLNGSISSAIENLNNAISLKLNNNAFTGIIPSEAGNLNNLEILWLQNNQFGGNIPMELCNLNSLEDLRLNNNQLEGCYDNCLSSFCNIQFANISNSNNFNATWNNFCSNNSGTCDDCRLTDSLALISLYNATNGPYWTDTWNINQSMNNWSGVILNENGCVTELNLQNNNLVGTIPSQIGNLSKLEILMLWANDLSGSIPSSIGNLINLTEIGLSSNVLTGSIPTSFGSLINIRELRLNSNNLSGSITSQLSDLENLTALTLDLNNFSGSIPSSFGRLLNLETLSISSNNLNGGIPSQLGDLPELRILNLRDNVLTGNIPSELGNLNNLRELGLNFNQLNGNIPTKLGDLKNLIQLNLDDNMLGGNIPYEFCNLSKVFHINLQNNQLVGGIPPCLSNLPNITSFIISNNNLSGCYDDDLLALCGKLTSQLFNGNATISNGNDFNIPWEDFCRDNTGICNLVWPGDFNNDGRVAVNDVLFWGLANGLTGPPRPNANSSWNSQDGPDWVNEVKGVNGRHQDGDGNGKVEGPDLQVLNNNFGLVRTSDVVFGPNSSYYFDFERSLGNGGIMYELYAKDPQNNILETHGIALTIDFGDYRFDSVSIDTVGSCLKPQRVFEKYDTTGINNTYHLALTRTNGINQTCESTNRIGIIIIVDNIPTGDPNFIMRIDGQNIKSDETLERMNKLSIEDNYPNDSPNSGQQVGLTINHVSCNIPESISVNTTLDPSLYTYKWNTGAATSEITDLTPGYYEVIVTNSFGNPPDTLSAEIQGQFISEYDENGNLIMCDHYSCPTLITLNNTVQNGLYQAGATINAKAAINSGNNVTFKAEDRIILNSGFSVPANTIFNATIENCQ